MALRPAAASFSNLKMPNGWLSVEVQWLIQQELEKAQKERIRDAIEVGHSKSQQARFREVVHKGR